MIDVTLWVIGTVVFCLFLLPTALVVIMIALHQGSVVAYWVYDKLCPESTKKAWE